MPSVEQNRKKWTEYAWPKQGDEWSREWGGPRREWFHTIYSRILPFLPAQRILEIAVGYGRWTPFLLDRCNHYYGVDIVERCIEHCQTRFASRAKARFSLNDGKTLPMIEDDSIDFVFSFDSLVHADREAIGSYLSELSRKLVIGGYGFFHHSNLGAYADRAEPVWNGPWRDPGVSATLFAQLCEAVNLTCVAQETVNWNQAEMNDCFSLFARLPENHPHRAEPPRLWENDHFDTERTNSRQISGVYRKT